MSTEALRSYVEDVLEAQGFPGFAVAVTDRDRLVASEVFGYANLDARTPVSRGTYFELGSIGKTFTAVVFLQLREEGLIGLDEPVTSYLPWFEARSGHAPITIHHLLTHSSGLMIGADQSGSSRFDVWALRETETGFPPGTRYLYSNIGYRTLGLVVEEVTGLPYPEAPRRRILEPLGLEGHRSRHHQRGPAQARDRLRANLRRPPSATLRPLGARDVARDGDRGRLAGGDGG